MLCVVVYDGTREKIDSTKCLALGTLMTCYWTFYNPFGSRLSANCVALVEGYFKVLLESIARCEASNSSNDLELLSEECD